MLVWAFRSDQLINGLLNGPSPSNPQRIKHFASHTAWVVVVPHRENSNCFATLAGKEVDAAILFVCLQRAKKERILGLSQYCVVIEQLFYFYFTN